MTTPAIAHACAAVQSRGARSVCAPSSATACLRAAGVDAVTAIGARRERSVDDGVGASSLGGRRLRGVAPLRRKSAGGRKQMAGSGRPALDENPTYRLGWVFLECLAGGCLWSCHTHPDLRFWSGHLRNLTPSSSLRECEISEVTRPGKILSVCVTGPEAVE